MSHLIYRIAPSDIAGMGLFATKTIKAGQMLDLPVNHPPDGCDGFNHSCDPNLSPRLDEGHTRQALRDIETGEELTAYYLNSCPCKACTKKPTVACRCPKCKGEVK